MNRFSLLLALTCALSACNGQQNDAKKVKKDIGTTLKEHTPGTIATSAAGYYMKAKIDGKDWEATSMMPIKGIDRAIGYSDNGDYISIPGIVMPRQEGYKITLGESYGVDINMKDKSFVDKDGNVILLDKQVGKVEVTKRDGDWLEGKFYFTAYSSKSDKKIQVTEGSFRTK